MNSFKKIFTLTAVLAFSLISSLSVFARNFDYIQQGEYAYYLDYRGGNAFYRGYLVFHMDDNTTQVISRAVDLKSKKSMNYVFVLKEEQGGMPSIVNEKGVPGDSPLFSQNVVDFLNFHIMYAQNDTKIGYNTSLNDDWPNYTQVYHYNKLLPMFRFLYISNDKYPMADYRLNRAGILSAKDYKSFFKMQPAVFKHGKQKAGYSIPDAAEQTVEFGSHSVILDQNWKVSSANGGKVASMGIASDLDAQFSVKPLSAKGVDLSSQLTKEEMLRTLLLRSADNADFSTLKVSNEDNGLALSIETFDESSKVFNFSYIKLLDDAVVNLTTFDFAYEAQKKYFKKILNSVK